MCQKKQHRCLIIDKKRKKEKRITAQYVEVVISAASNSAEVLQDVWCENVNDITRLTSQRKGKLLMIGTWDPNLNLSFGGPAN